MKLFSSKEDIEKMGFIYEPDKEKCKIFKTNVYYGSIEVIDSNVERTTIMTLDDYNPREYKLAIAQSCPFTNVHSFEVPDDNPTKDGHWDVLVCIRGHTLKEEANLLNQVLGEEKSSAVRETLSSINVIDPTDKDEFLRILESVYIMGYRDGKKE